MVQLHYFDIFSENIQQWAPYDCYEIAPFNSVLFHNEWHILPQQNLIQNGVFWAVTPCG
jgi:hypothetical protein